MTTEYGEIMCLECGEEFQVKISSEDLENGEGMSACPICPGRTHWSCVYEGDSVWLKEIGSWRKDW